MDVTYRDFEERDFEDLRDMIFCLYDEDPEGLPINDEKIGKTTREYKKHPEKLRVVMILKDGEAVGYGILVFFWSNEYGGNIVVIDELYVKKAYRNARIATDFIKSRMAACENAAALEVETTASNSAATRLYKRLGFESAENNRLVLKIEKDPLRKP